MLQQDLCTLSAIGWALHVLIRLLKRQATRSPDSLLSLVGGEASVIQLMSRVAKLEVHVLWAVACLEESAEFKQALAHAKAKEEIGRAHV